MTTPYPASLAMVSSGQLLFADASQTGWDPSQFPTLPPVNIALTAQGAAGPSTLSSLTLTNSNLYEPFEPVSIRPTLVKQVQINSGGLLTFEESKVGFVSTAAAAFQAPVSQFTPAAPLGGAALQDVTSGTPDTTTNALGKLDAWITNAFLLQPPAVVAAQAETNSLWGGVRWTNFNTYNVLDKFVPYVASVVIIIGDPTTPNYCTLEITDGSLFPYKTYTDGISPQPEKRPLVALRVFTDFLPIGQDVYYTKKQLQTQCIRIVSESGDVTFPTTGNVASLSYTNGSSSYTTLSLFLPMLPVAYPNGTPVPVRIAYLNETAGPTRVATLSTLQTTTGGPSPPAAITLLSAATGEIDLQVARPQYSDSNAQTTEPYFSSYVVSYKYNQLAVANTAQIGFQYGTPSATTTPSTLSTYVGNLYEQSFVAWNSTQTLAVTGSSSNSPVVPGVVWSTTVKAFNAAPLQGGVGAGPVVSTLFPSDPAPTLLSVPLYATDPTQVAVASTIFTTTHGPAGWTVGPSVGHDVLFLSTVGPLTFRTTSTVQYNDASYPGDRTPIQVSVKQTNTLGNTGTPVTLTTTPTSNDYALGALFPAAANQAQIAATLSDTQSTFGYTHYFYAADLSGAVTVSTIATATQSVRLLLANTRIPSFSAAPVSQTTASPSYIFSTEFSARPSTTGVLMKSITSTIFISGLATPTPYAQFFFDMSGANFAYRYTASTLASAQLVYNSIAVGPLTGFSNNVPVYNGTTPVSALPFPVNTVLTLSSLAVQANANLYTDPNDLGVLNLVVSVTPANPTPQGHHIAISTTIQEYIDTVSYPCLAKFTDATGSNGARILSLVPNINDLSTSQYFMDDGVDFMGNSGQGLNTTVSTLFTTLLPSTIQINSTILYDHTQSISSIYTNYYSRELLFTDGFYIHPAGYNFTQFNDGFQYPDFTYDLYNDTTFGYRYASFAFEGPDLASPTPYSHVYVRVNQPSLLSSIQMTRNENNWWPDTLTNHMLVSSMKVRMHYKLLGTYNLGLTYPIETAWVNCLKQVDFYNFDDQTYDAGATSAVSRIGGDVEYKMELNRRYYLKTMLLVRVGISQDGAQYTGQPITFTGLQARLSDS